MSKKFRLLMVLVLVTGLLGGLLSSTVSADPNPGTVIEIPRIDKGGGWDTKIQIQNVSLIPTTVTVEFWSGWSQTCPPQSASTTRRQMVVPAGGVWTLHNAIPDGVESAFVTTSPAAYLAVTVDRWGTDPYGEFQISSSYTGVADPAMTGPVLGRKEYFAPYIMHGYHDLDTVLTIQNSGDACTSIWIYYKQQGNCECMKAQHIEQIRPGEAIRIGPGFGADVSFPKADAPLGCSPGSMDWLGSAYITANEPLAIIVDQLSLAPSANRGVLSTMRGLPYYQEFELEWYADLLYREISGWSSSIQVQNLTVTSQPTFVTVDFFDQSGDEILFVGDWVCRNGAKTFYLPAITDLGVNFPFGYVGAAEIQSHPQVDYPGGTHVGQPIFAVVDLKKDKVYDESLPGWRHTVAGEIQGGAYNAHPQAQKEDMFGWAMPFIAKEQQGVTSRIAIRNNANCNKITGRIDIYDETARRVTTIPVPWLHPKHMKVFDLAYFGQIARGFVGAAVFRVGVPIYNVFGVETGWDYYAGVEQLCDQNADGITDQLPVMPSVVVLNYGFATELPIGSGAGPQTTLGDLTRLYEGIPILELNLITYGAIFGTVTVRQESHGYDRPEINGVTVAAGDQSATTDSTGGYKIPKVMASEVVTTTAAKTGFFTGTEYPKVEVGKETLLDFELICSNVLTATVTATGEDGAAHAVPDATVTAVATYEYNADKTEAYTTTGTTNNAGLAVFDVAGAASLKVSATAPGHDPNTNCTPVTGVDGVAICYDTYTAACRLCKWNTIVGTVTIGSQLAAGYTLQAYDMSVAGMPMVDSDVTTAAGVYSLENFSEKAATYRIYLLSPSGTTIGMKDVNVDTHCGETATLLYNNGTWTGPTW